MPEEILRVQSRRAARQRRITIAQHAIGAIVLISAGTDHVSHEHGAALALAIAEIVAGVLLIFSIARERLHKRHHGGIAWVELAGAAMVFVEATEKSRQPHHVSFIILTFVQPMMLFMFAIFDAQIAAARYLKADGNGFEARLRLLFRRKIAWENVRDVHIVGNKVEIDLTGGGKRTINLRDVVDRETALRWTEEQFRRRLVTE